MKRIFRLSRVASLILMLGSDSSAFTTKTSKHCRVLPSASSTPPSLSSLKLSRSRHATRLNAVSVGKRSWSERWENLVSTPNAERPPWARDWMPTWLLNLRPPVQMATVLLFYVFHLFFLTQRSISFPFQLIPNERGHFQSIGLDS